MSNILNSIDIIDRERLRGDLENMPLAAWDQVRQAAELGALVLELPKKIESRGKIKLEYSVQNNLNGTANAGWQVSIDHGMKPGNPHGSVAHGWSRMKTAVEALREAIS